MSGVYSVWTQIIDDTTTPANIDAFGSVHDVLAEQEDDEGGTPNKQFCDGQTSKTPPRYATDNMIGIYTRSPESAQIISDFMRQDVVNRIQSGQLRVPLPTWYTIDPAVIKAAEMTLLRAKMLQEFPRIDEELITEALDAVVNATVDKTSTGSIIRQMRTRLSR